VPVDPFTHNHRRHAIAIIDNKHRDDCAEFHDHETDCPVKHDDRPVTVADLLDALYDGYNDNDRAGEYFDLRRRATASAVLSHRLIDKALTAHRILTPEERAEFDRRTT
jgi:hypothetical protein